MFTRSVPPAVLTIALLCAAGSGLAAEETPHPLHFIHTAFENASPLWWEVDAEGVVHVHLVYDHERQSPNRANGHWHFRIEAEPGADLTLTLGPFANIYNGRLGTAVREPATAFVSEDEKQWRAVKMEYIEPDRRRLKVQMSGPALYVARLEPYRISDLQKLKAQIAPSSVVEITSIGHTVEGRPLEIIRVGTAAAPHRVLIRARAHPWESGGNWVVEGLIRRLLQDDEVAKQCLATYCLYVMPMANKDGVARGYTRFNVNGKDLNRDWLQPADPRLAPENAALERWLEAMIARGQRPDLAIDLHNDAWGGLHFPRGESEEDRWEDYLASLKRFEVTLRANSCFTESTTTGLSGAIAAGLQKRYGIAACIHELNCDWMAGLDDYPSAANWKKYGGQLGVVFCKYFQQRPAAR